ncbi:hypothetical protein MED134_08141 [Dokdonia sp. MED134]|uniref:GEVED domain-containing protein n=1 Tax=Dokdonia sp. MED134 TaxID=313590 RepID=UPI000068D0B5|nr:GEVED domain-containing protein [Dokdonia sp. MED134]EAQ39445.1 hypothetical protein MED134_08141 [Dokdonia sp. MED134]
MKKINLLLCIALLAFGFGISAQETEPVGPFTVTTAATVTQMPSIASRSELIPSVDKPGPVQDGRASKYEIVPGKGSTGDDILAHSQHRSTNTIQGRTPSLVLETALSNSQPTDPSGAVGPNHYFAVFNTGFRIFDKDGTPLTAQLGTGNIFPASGCCDLTVSYDNLADRWVVSFLGGGVQVAISNGPDPVTSEWTVYNFPSISDYNKLSVWRDGYYVTENTGGSTKLWVLERAFLGDGTPDPAAQMAGFQLPGIVTSGFHSPQALNITDDNHPTTGGCPIVYLQDDAWGGVTADHIKLWEATMDWDTPANSTVSAPLEISTAPFVSVFDNGSFANLTQPGGQDIDALQATIMNQAQFRKFGDHNSAVFNFVVDTDGSAAELAGIRWVELRQDSDGGAWSLFQEGTYTAPDGKHAWHGSMAMDSQGNIGLGYTAMAGPETPTDGSVDLVLSSYYTGRYAADAPGTMSVEETLIAKGSGNIPGSERYGDYGKMDVDPVNGKEFWFLNEYVGASGRANVLGVFQIAPNFPNDLGVTSIDTPVTGTLTATEDVTVTIFNFGENDKSGFDVTYQIDGGALVTEAFIGTIPSATSATFTFATQADLSAVGQTYSIVASTSFAEDEDNSNDSTTKEVTHLNPIDTGVVTITTPESGSGLSDAEVVTVTIQNFGGETQTSIPVFYILDGGAPVQETFTGSIASGETATYTFTATIDLSELGDYTIVAGTEITGDADESNDDFTFEVSNFICQPVSNCAGFDDGVTGFQLADQDISVSCSTTSEGYSDNSDVVFNFILEENPFVGTLQMGFDDSIYALWIDFNDNNAFEDDELVSSEQVASANSDFEFTIDFNDFPGLTTGMHRMRLRGEDESTAGDVLDPCGDLAFGRTNDFTANITGMLLGLQDEEFAEADFSIVESSKNNFDINFITSYEDLTGLRVYNMLGQEVLYYNMTKEGDRYTYSLDMNYVSKGVYIVQVGTLDGTSMRTQKLVVK